MLVSFHAAFFQGSGSLLHKKNASQAFEVATVALSFKADLQRNKCCQLDPVLSTLCYMKNG